MDLIINLYQEKLENLTIVNVNIKKKESVHVRFLI